MSFICDNCHRPQRNQSQPIRIVTKTRPAYYPPRYKGKELIDKGGVGEEIAEEKNFCSRCAKGVK